MKLRKHYPIIDRTKILIILLLIAYLLGCLAIYKYKENGDTKKSTIEYFIQMSLEPVGSTMYIWGGGWDAEDSQSGAGSTKIGLSPQWKVFAENQDDSYDFTEHRFEREKGLDCSGYVGWVIYNTFETEDGQPGYVTTSTDLAESLANRGWGTLIKNPEEFLPGDIVSMEGHVWICLGTCADGSVLLVHSSPPGVSVCGTPLVNDTEHKTSIAVQLATEFMTENYPKWQQNYPNRTVSSSYLENVSVFRWNKSTMLDAGNVQQMSGEEIIVYMSPDI